MIGTSQPITSGSSIAINRLIVENSAFIASLIDAAKQDHTTSVVYHTTSVVLAPIEQNFKENTIEETINLNTIQSIEISESPINLIDNYEITDIDTIKAQHSVQEIDYASVAIRQQLTLFFAKKVDLSSPSLVEAQIGWRTMTSATKCAIHVAEG